MRSNNQIFQLSYLMMLSLLLMMRDLKRQKLSYKKVLRIHKHFNNKKDSNLVIIKELRKKEFNVK